MSWWRVETSFAVAAVRTENDTIVEAAPIFRRWVGRELWRLERAHNAQITLIHEQLVGVPNGAATEAT